MFLAIGSLKSVFKAHVLAENMNWIILRESLLNMLLVCLNQSSNFNLHEFNDFSILWLCYSFKRFCMP